MRMPSLSPAGGLVLALGVLALPACMMSIDGTTQHIARVEKRFAVTGVPNVSLVTFDGAVEVRSWDRPEVVVEVEKRATDPADAEAIQVVAEQSGGNIRVEARQPARGRALVQVGVHPSARLIASVPAKVNLTVRTGDGNVTVERLVGRVDLDTEDGAVRVIGASGALRVHSGDGNLRLEEVDGPVEVDTGDGGVSVVGRLTTLRLSTGDGTVSVRAEQGSAMAGEWELRTGDGGVTLELPAGFGAQLDAEAGEGSVRVVDHDFAAATSPSRRIVRGRLNAGGPVLHIRTGDGRIVVKRE